MDTKIREFLMLKQAKRLVIQCLLNGFSLKLDRDGYFVATRLERINNYRVDLTCRFAKDLKGKLRVEVCVNQQFLALEELDTFSVEKLLDMPVVRKSRAGAVI